MNGYQGLGHGSASATTHVGQTANVTVSKFMGSHSFKMGGDYRRISAETAPPNTMSFGSPQAYTQGPNPNTASAAPATRSPVSCSAIRQPATFNTTTLRPVLPRLLLGVRAGRLAHQSKLTLNFGLRYEYEPGHRRARRRASPSASIVTRLPGAGAGHAAEGRADVCRRGRLPDAPGPAAQRRRAARRLRVFDDRQDGRSRRLRLLLGADDRSRHRRSGDWLPRLLRGHDDADQRRWRPHAGQHAEQPVPDRDDAAAGQLARPADRRRRRHRFRVAGLEAWLRAAVLGRLPARAAGQHGR